MSPNNGKELLSEQILANFGGSDVQYTNADLNSSIMSGQSSRRGYFSNNLLSQSVMAKRGQNKRESVGRIKKNNMNEIVSYLADELQQETNAYSRQGRSMMAVNQSHDISMNTAADHQASVEYDRYRRGDSISRMLG